MGKRLDRLLAYTTFHIGVYITLAAALIGARAFGTVSHPVLKWALVCFIVAGGCGGIIAANIADFMGAHEADFFKPWALKVWGVPAFTYSWLAWLEHVTFWAGVLPVAWVSYHGFLVPSH